MLDALAEFVQPAATLQAALSSAAGSAFPGAAISVYLTTPFGLEPSVVVGSSDDTAPRNHIAVDHPLYRAIVTERRPVSIVNKSDDAALSGEGLAGVPILHPESGRVIGMLKLDSAMSTLVSAHTLGRLALIGRLAAPLIGEPRIVIDNTERGVAAAGARLTRGWRQFSWQLQPVSEPSSPLLVEESGPENHGAVDRSRASK